MLVARGQPAVERGAASVSSASIESLGPELVPKLSATRAELLDEYRQSHHHPWIIGYSGGKDSTLVVQLAFEMLLDLPPTERDRPIHVVANDTLVESPLVVAHINRTIEQFRGAAEALRLPIVACLTRPDPDQTFWVNLIGRGYPSPSRSFRWCTDRMKIQPTSRYVREQACATGNVILLLGVRRAESAARAARTYRYNNGRRLNPHNDLAGCMVFRPILDLTTDEVWELLATLRPPWGGQHDELIALYRNAQGGECPVVTQRTDAPSCGSSSSRFGCWTCTVVVKDRSLEGFIEAGFSEFAPLIEFRDWLAQIRDESRRRMARRRNGGVTHLSTGSLVPGPFTFDTRREILDRLLTLEALLDRHLITKDEISRIHAIWAEDVTRACASPRGTT
jgi:DNA sulfur modification protein DndC